jgi:hypothetical protein
MTPDRGHFVPDDGSLVDDNGQPLVRTYIVTGGPRYGQWLWTVLVDVQDRRVNGETGYEETGAAATGACDALFSLSSRRTGSRAQKDRQPK